MEIILNGTSGYLMLPRPFFRDVKTLQSEMAPSSRSLRRILSTKKRAPIRHHFMRWRAIIRSRKNF